MTLTVTGQHISENAGASAGFAGFGGSLSVLSCSLATCGGNPDARPQQSGTASIAFPGTPSDPSRTFAFEAFLSDTTQVSANCRTRYIYEFIPAN
jgi:hypothetical protein